MNGEAQQGTVAAFLTLVARPAALIALIGAWIAYAVLQKLQVALAGMAALEGGAQRIAMVVTGFAVSALIMGIHFLLARALASPEPRWLPLTGRFANAAFVYLMLIALVFSGLGEQVLRLQMEYGWAMKQVILVHAAVDLALKIALLPALVLLAALAVGDGDNDFRTYAARLSGPRWDLWFGYCVLLALLAFTALLLNFRLNDAPVGTPADTMPLQVMVLLPHLMTAVQAVFASLWAILSYRALADQA